MRNQIVLDTLQEIAHEVGAGPVYLVPPSSMTDDNATTTTQVMKQMKQMKQKQQTTSRPIIGSQDFVIENERTARTVLRALRESGRLVMDDESTASSSFSTSSFAMSSAMLSALATNPPCRFQEVVALDDTNFVLDVAHNPEALTKLFDRFQKIHQLETMDQVQVVVGMSVDKDLQTCMNILKQSGLSSENILLVQSTHPRAAPVSYLASYLPNAVIFETETNCHVSSIAMGVSYAIERARERARIRRSEGAAGEGGAGEGAAPIIICGSLYIMDEVQQVLGIGREDQMDSYIVQQAWSDRKIGTPPPTTNAEDLQQVEKEKEEKEEMDRLVVGSSG